MGPPLSEDVLRAAVDEIFLAETWRPGGPRRGEVVRLYSRALETGDAHVIQAIWSQIRSLSSYRLFDPNSLLPFMPLPASPSAAEATSTYSDIEIDLREQVALWNRTHKDREAFYREAIEKRGSDPSSAVSWQYAATLALRQGQYALIPTVENACDVQNCRFDSNAVITEVLLPLARARQRPDWAGRYVALVSVAARSLERDCIVKGPECDSNQLLIVKEGLQALVIANQKGTIPALQALLESFLHGSGQPSANSHAACYAECARHRMLLLRAIRALGRGSYHRLLWQTCRPISAADLEAAVFIRPAR